MLIQFRSAEEILPMVKDLLSPAGKATLDLRTNSILIIDDPESLGKIQAFIKRVDAPVKQAGVHLRFLES